MINSTGPDQMATSYLGLHVATSYLGLHGFVKSKEKMAWFNRTIISHFC